MMKKKDIILSIETTDNKRTSVMLEIDGKKNKIMESTHIWSSQVLLPMTEKLLKDNHLNIHDLTQIKVNPGPGSYTGIRVGITVAKVLGWFLEIPVNGRKYEGIEPKYQ